MQLMRITIKKMLAERLFLKGLRAFDAERFSDAQRYLEKAANKGHYEATALIQRYERLGIFINKLPNFVKQPPCGRKS